MTEGENQKRYDLEERTELFARRCRELVRKLPRTITNIEDARQLTRACCSVAVNFIEANEALSKKDLCMRVKISRKESKESRLFLRLIYPDGETMDAERQALVQDARELLNIFGAILRNSQ